MKPVVADIYHGDFIDGDDCMEGMAKIKSSGILGVIHKATQGTRADFRHDARRKAAETNGLLWGSYHFNNGNSIKSQVNAFLDVAQPNDNTLLALDFEPTGTNMTVHNAVLFMRMVEEKTKHTCVLYSGSRIKETIKYLSLDDKKFITSKRLWLCEYGNTVRLPDGFDKYWIWQYTGDGEGPTPHHVDGVRGYCDLNVYDGTDDQLKAEWSGFIK